MGRQTCFVAAAVVCALAACKQKSDLSQAQNTEAYSANSSSDVQKRALAIGNDFPKRNPDTAFDFKDNRRIEASCWNNPGDGFKSKFPSPEDLYIDARCAQLIFDRPRGYRKSDGQNENSFAKQGLDPEQSAFFQEANNPQGRSADSSKTLITKGLTFFGSSRLGAGHRAFHATWKFAQRWGRLNPANRFQSEPLITAGGPGTMLAADCGAFLAGGKVFGLGAVFAQGLTFPQLLNTNCETKGYIYRSFSLREAEMVNRAARVIFAPGGFGTEWEIFETLSKIQTGKHPSGHPPTVFFTALDDSDLNVRKAEGAVTSFKDPSGKVEILTDYVKELERQIAKFASGQKLERAEKVNRGRFEAYLNGMALSREKLKQPATLTALRDEIIAQQKADLKSYWLALATRVEAIVQARTAKPEEQKILCFADSVDVAFRALKTTSGCGGLGLLDWLRKHRR